MKKRSDIDGLRALAVLPVLFYHAGLPGFGGGYVGVDVFFVISGFLITKIIADEITADRFSILNFYNRRIRRIFPALFAVVLATTVMAVWLLGPSGVEEFGQSLVYVVFMAANVFYWQTSGYFETAAEIKPMLHTWSLGVEEQFYVFFPLILLATRRWLRSWKVLAWIGLIASLALSIYGVRFYANATFYLLPTRAWELLAGSVLALGAFPVLRNEAQRQVLGILGLAAIIGPVLLYTSQTPFPGEAAILPVLGAALIIATGSDGKPTWAAKLLSLGPVVFIGLISYSLYLWHWPVVVFARFLLEDSALLLQTGVIVFLSLILAAVSWRYIEQPFRHPSPDGSSWMLRARPVAIGAMVSVVFAVVGFSMAGLFRNDGFISAFYSPQIAELNDLSRKTASPDDCVRKVGAAVRLPECVLGDADVKPTVALVGDSTADALWRSMDAMLERSGRAGLRYIYHSCPIIAGTVRNEAGRLGAGFADNCRRYVDRALADVIADPAIKFVVLQNAYSIYFAQKPDGVGELPLLWQGRPATTRQDLIAATVATAQMLSDNGKTVVMIGAIPGNVQEFGAANIVARLVRTGEQPARTTLASADCVPSFDDINAALKIAQSDSIIYLDAAAQFLDDPDNPSECVLVRDGRPVTSDGTHVSAFVADAVARQVEDMIVAHSK